MSSFRINPARRMSVVEVGCERLPVICIDNFSLDPDALVTLATEAVFIDVGSRYPGVRAPAPQEYVAATLEALGAIVEQTYGALPATELDLCAYSMVTSAPAQLRPIQRIPHFDGPDSARFAFLHYLCASHQGGTSFYRHRATGFEIVTPDRVADFRRQVMQEFKDEEPGRDYVTDDTRFFERIYGIEAMFNRLIVYKGNALHSGDISSRTILSEDPRQGRLTINGFGFLSKPP